MPESNRRIDVLQTPAFPLRQRAASNPIPDGMGSSKISLTQAEIKIQIEVFYSPSLLGIDTSHP